MHGFAAGDSKRMPKRMGRVRDSSSSPISVYCCLCVGHLLSVALVAPLSLSRLWVSLRVSVCCLSLAAVAAIVAAATSLLTTGKETPGHLPHPRPAASCCGGREGKSAVASLTAVPS